MSGYPAVFVAAAATSAIAGISKMVADSYENAKGSATAEENKIKLKVLETSAENANERTAVDEEVDECRREVLKIYKKGADDADKLRKESEAEYEELKKFYTRKLKDQDKLIVEYRNKMTELRIEGKQEMENVHVGKECEKVKMEDKLENQIKVKAGELDSLREKAIEIQKECLEREDEKASSLKDFERLLEDRQAETMTAKERCLGAYIGAMYSLMNRAEELAEMRVKEAQFFYLQERSCSEHRRSFHRSSSLDEIPNPPSGTTDRRLSID